MYRALKPKLILMDVSMPEMNGYEATRARSARPKRRRQRIRRSSASPRTRSRATARNASRPAWTTICRSRSRPDKLGAKIGTWLSENALAKTA